MPYRRPPRPKSAYDSGRASLSASWMDARTDEWLNGQLRLTSKLAVTSDYHRGRLDAIRAELRKRGDTNR